MDKICIACKKSKNVSEFPPNKNMKDGLNRKCRLCFNEYMRQWYEKPENKKKQMARAAVSNMRAKNRAREFIWNYLSENPCPCGESDPVVLEFDHLDRDSKDYNVSGMFTLSIDRIKKEISKCRVLCCNCHRRHTTAQLGTWRGTWPVR